MIVVTYSSVRLPVEARYCSCMRVYTQNMLNRKRSCSKPYHGKASIACSDQRESIILRRPRSYATRIIYRLQSTIALHHSRFEKKPRENCICNQRVGLTWSRGEYLTDKIRTKSHDDPPLNAAPS